MMMTIMMDKKNKTKSRSKIMPIVARDRSKKKTAKSGCILLNRLSTTRKRVCRSIKKTHFNDGIIDLKRNNSLDLCLILEIKQKPTDNIASNGCCRERWRLIDFWRQNVDLKEEKYFIIKSDCGRKGFLFYFIVFTENCEQCWVTWNAVKIPLFCGFNSCEKIT